MWRIIWSALWPSLFKNLFCIFYHYKKKIISKYSVLAKKKACFPSLFVKKKNRKENTNFCIYKWKNICFSIFHKKNGEKKKNLHVYLDLITSLLNLLRFDLNKLNHWAYIQKKQKYMFFFIKKWQEF